VHSRSRRNRWSEDVQRKDEVVVEGKGERVREKERRKR